MIAAVEKLLRRIRQFGKSEIPTLPDPEVPPPRDRTQPRHELHDIRHRVQTLRWQFELARLRDEKGRQP